MSTGDRVAVWVMAGGQYHDYQSIGRALADSIDASTFRSELVLDDLSALTRLAAESVKVLVFFHTVGKISPTQRDALLSWVAGGGGFIGIHSAADSFRDCPEYRSMVGGYFLEHPPYRDYQVSIVQPWHPITDGMTEFFVKDEMFVTSYDSRVHVLATALWKGSAIPVAWTNQWGKGRVFYLAFGHDEAAVRQEAFQKLFERGLQWASGARE
jgi:type 1 glutamine amidotransferase